MFYNVQTNSAAKNVAELKLNAPIVSVIVYSLYSHVTFQLVRVTVSVPMDADYVSIRFVPKKSVFSANGLLSSAGFTKTLRWHLMLAPVLVLPEM